MSHLSEIFGTVSMARGASFNDELEYEVGTAIAKEVIAGGANFLQCLTCRRFLVYRYRIIIIHNRAPLQTYFCFIPCSLYKINLDYKRNMFYNNGNIFAR